ncbi:rCG21390 [Rattus norvegicus]|uniref:RCG21390 n=1 Tax=Rattus norvegicus TaxID=10116 RepID=A6J0V6_RAT|nr:rCG21390 [Rattus norvegicus]
MESTSYEIFKLIFIIYKLPHKLCPRWLGKHLNLEMKSWSYSVTHTD